MVKRETDVLVVGAGPVGLFAALSLVERGLDVQIPLLRKKVANIMQRAGYTPNSHAAKALLNILETYPRDDLFQTQESEVLETVEGVYCDMLVDVFEQHTGLCTHF